MNKAQKAKKFILDTDGKFFSIKFIKRSTGKEREMLARTMPPTGGIAPYNPDEHNLIFVYDMQKEGWRSIPLDAVISAKCGDNVLEIGE